MKLYKLFEEVLSNSQEYIDVFNEGKKFFPKLRLDYTTLSGGKKLHLRFFLNYPKNKGSFSLGGFKNHLTFEKISMIKRWLIAKGINLEVSKSIVKSGSFYFFNKENQQIRVSDHLPKKNDTRPNLIVTWDTKPEAIKKFMLDNKVI